MTYGYPPNPEAEKARLEADARRAVDNTPPMQAAREVQGAKANAEWQVRQTVGDVKEAGSFFSRIAGWFKRG